MTSDKAVPPGGEGEIKATLNPRGRSGKMVKAITVNTNDPENPALKLMLSAFIRAAVNVEPRTLNFGNVEAGSIARKQVTVWLREDLKGEITGVQSSSEHMLAKLLPRPDDKGRRVVEIEIAKRAAPGPLHSVITVNTSLGSKAQARISARAQVIGDLVLEPRSLNLRTTEGKVVVRRRDESRPPFRILSARPSVKEFKAEVVEVEKGARYEIHMKVEPTAQRHRGVLAIKTDSVKHPEISLSLSYVKRVPRAERRGKGGRKLEVRKPPPKPLVK